MGRRRGRGELLAVARVVLRRPGGGFDLKLAATRYGATPGKSTRALALRF